MDDLLTFGELGLYKDIMMMDALEGRNIEEDINFFLEQQTSHQAPQFPHFPPPPGNNQGIETDSVHWAGGAPLSNYTHSVQLSVVIVH